MRGLTNLIKFDNQGFRTDFTLDVIELSPSGIRKVGDWNSTQGVNFTRSYNEHQNEIVENLKNKTLVVTTILVIFVLYVHIFNIRPANNSIIIIVYLYRVHLIVCARIRLRN